MGPFVYSFEHLFWDRFLGAAQPCARICGLEVLAQRKRLAIKSPSLA